MSTDTGAMSRHDFLEALHRRLRPRTYLEVGVDNGSSLALSRVPSIGVDPAYTVVTELQADVHLARTTSDQFFAREKPLAHLPLDVVDLAFLDGMHLAEYLLRDYLAVERFTLPSSVVVCDDMLPRTVEEASRVRPRGPWTGDVYRAIQALRDHRPDLLVLEVDTAPTGVAVVLGPDASRDGVAPWYDEWVDGVVGVDPQPVPTEVLERSRAWDPAELLELELWDNLAALREAPAERSSAEVRRVLENFSKTAGAGS